MPHSCHLPPALQAQLEREARKAWPNECCGLLAGRSEGGRLMIEQLIPMTNLATASDRFALDPAEHIAVAKSLRGTQMQLLGCYHSHPNGQSQPSALDLAQAGPDSFLWLIIGLSASQAPIELGAYIHQSSRFRILQLA